MRPLPALPTAHSLRLNLVLWLVAPLGIIAAVMAWIAYSNAALTAAAVTDRILAASAQTIAEQVKVENGEATALIPPSALGIFATGAGDRVVYKVLDPTDDLIAGIADVPVPARRPSVATPVYFEAAFRGQPFRGIAMIQPVVGFTDPRDASGEVTVIVAATEHDEAAMTRSLWLQGIQPIGILLVLVAGLGWFGLNRGLKPLDRIRRDLADRSETDLSPLSVAGLPSEVHPLVTAFNGALGRIESYIAAQRRFVANAAHQLHTPLTLLKMQTHYGLTEETVAAKDEALSALDSGLGQLSRLINQLLTLARAEPHTPTKPDVKPADIVALAMEALANLAPLALDKAIDLSFERDPREHSGPLLVAASPTLLREMVANLVDNALCYTPVGGRVAVLLGRQDASGASPAEAVIRVVDTGPGIPPDERERVFERFYRVLRPGVEGNGLGLAIVREIASGAGGSVSLADGPGGVGLEAVVRLPLLAHPSERENPPAA
ncbi:MAG: sensor histidine kinase N-terminal domain-containing protein [Ancalomicrobiaceae bacterium]|nr:sensor histidine kinase N-terminal domain-containing protein [Ancalomicrobiaceae bacterium]